MSNSVLNFGHSLCEMDCLICVTATDTSLSLTKYLFEYPSAIHQRIQKDLYRHRTREPNRLTLPRIRIDIRQCAKIMFIERPYRIIESVKPVRFQNLLRFHVCSPIRFALPLKKLCTYTLRGPTLRLATINKSLLNLSGAARKIRPQHHRAFSTNQFDSLLYRFVSKGILFDLRFVPSMSPLRRLRKYKRIITLIHMGQRSTKPLRKSVRFLCTVFPQSACSLTQRKTDSRHRSQQPLKSRTCKRIRYHSLISKELLRKKRIVPSKDSLEKTLIFLFLWRLQTRSQQKILRLRRKTIEFSVPRNRRQSLHLLPQHIQRNLVVRHE